MNNSNNDFIDLTNLEEARTGTHIIIDYVSCTFPLIVYDGQREDDIILDTISLILNEMGYTDDDLVQDEYALNRFKYQYTIASSIVLRLVGPVLKNGYHSCQIELKGEGCREWECHNIGKTWKDFLEFFLVKLNGRPTRIDLTIDDFDGKDVDLDFIRYKMDNNFYTTTFRDKKYVIHGNDDYGFTLALGSHESTQELCIYEKNKEQKKKKEICIQPYWLRYEMRFRREKAYDICMNLINTDVEKYSDFFYTQLYNMLDLKEDNTYDDNNQYKIPTDPKWSSFLNNVSKCKLNKYKVQKTYQYDTYLKWATPIVGKYILYTFLENTNLDEAIIKLLNLSKEEKLKERDFIRINEIYKAKDEPIKTAEDLIRARNGIEALIGIFANIKVEPEAE